MYSKVSFALFALLLFSFIGTKAQNVNLAPQDFVAKIKATKDAQLLDVRTPQEWQAGKIASSECINVNDTNFKQEIEKLDKNKPVFVYCAAGGRSSKAVPILQAAGFKQIYNLTGGGYKDLEGAGLK